MGIRESDCPGGEKKKKGTKCESICESTDICFSDLKPK